MEAGGHSSAGEETSDGQSHQNPRKRRKTTNTDGALRSDLSSEQNEEGSQRSPSIFSTQHDDRRESTETSQSSSHGLDSSTSGADSRKVRPKRSVRFAPLPVSSAATPQHSGPYRNPLPAPRPPAPRASFALPGFHTRYQLLTRSQFESQIARDAERYGWTQNPLASMANFMTLKDTQQKIVDDLADKFAQIITLASSSGDGEDVTGQESAGRTLEINVETQGLIHAAEQYLSFNRKLKELWLFGQIRDIGEGEEEDVGDMESNSTKVREMVEQLIQSKNGRVSTAAKEALNDVQNGGALKVLERTEEAAETLGALGAQGKDRKGDGDTEMGM